MNSIALIFDVGCFVLIWLVQLVIYPSFQYYPPRNLRLWHTKYTKAVTFVVLPLMLGQLIMAVAAFSFSNKLTLIKLLLIGATWITTFMIFVPLHNKVNSTKDPESLTIALVQKNWIRTVLWTLILIISLFNSAKL